MSLLAALGGLSLGCASGDGAPIGIPLASHTFRVDWAGVDPGATRCEAMYRATRTVVLLPGAGAGRREVPCAVEVDPEGFTVRVPGGWASPAGWTLHDVSLTGPVSLWFSLQERPGGLPPADPLDLSSSGSPRDWVDEAGTMRVRGELPRTVMVPPERAEVGVIVDPAPLATVRVDHPEGWHGWTDRAHPPNAEVAGPLVRVAPGTTVPIRLRIGRIRATVGRPALEADAALVPTVLVVPQDRWVATFPWVRPGAKGVPVTADAIGALRDASEGWSTTRIAPADPPESPGPTSRGDAQTLLVEVPAEATGFHHLVVAAFAPDDPDAVSDDLTFEVRPIEPP